MSTTTNAKAAKNYYKGGAKVSVGGVPCRMARKPGEHYRKALKEGQHGFDRVSLASVLEAEARYAAERLGAMGLEAPEAPAVKHWERWGAAYLRSMKAWNKAIVQAYLDALADLGRPQTFAEVVDESEPMLDLDPGESGSAATAIVEGIATLTIYAIAEVLQSSDIMSPSIVQRTREHFADLGRRCIVDAETGVTRVNDLESYRAWRLDGIARTLAGADDHTFTFRQMAHYFATGECVPLLEPPTRKAA